MVSRICSVELDFGETMGIIEDSSLGHCSCITSSYWHLVQVRARNIMVPGKYRVCVTNFGKLL